jgi:hypothetical protein
MVALPEVAALAEGLEVIPDVGTTPRQGNNVVLADVVTLAPMLSTTGTDRVEPPQCPKLCLFNLAHRIEAQPPLPRPLGPCLTGLMFTTARTGVKLGQEILPTLRTTVHCNENARTMVIGYTMV